MKRLVSLFVAMMLTISIMAQSNKNYVDLGLSSGTLWATCNVGAKFPEQFGDHFGWGEIIPHFNKGKWSEPLYPGYYGYVWTNYKHCKRGYVSLTKYCCHADYGDNGFTAKFGDSGRFVC